MKKNIEVSENMVVTASNDFWAQACINVKSINALKIIKLLMAQCENKDGEFGEYYIKINQLAKYLQISASNLYRDAASICRQLCGTTISSKTEHAIVRVNIFSSCAYDAENATMIFCFSNIMKNFLLQLKANYTSISLKHLLSISSRYTMRIYEILCYKYTAMRSTTKNFNKIVMTVDEIRKATDTESVFINYYDFKKNILNKAVNEINSLYVGWFVSYNEIKDSKDNAVKEIEFVISSATDGGQNISKEQLDGILDAERRRIAVELLQERMNPEQIAKITRIPFETITKDDLFIKMDK